MRKHVVCVTPGLGFGNEVRCQFSPLSSPPHLLREPGDGLARLGGLRCSLGKIRPWRMDPNCRKKFGQRVNRFQDSASVHGSPWSGCWSWGHHCGIGVLVENDKRRQIDSQTWRNCATHASDKGLVCILLKELYEPILKSPKPYKK